MTREAFSSHDSVVSSGRSIGGSQEKSGGEGGPSNEARVIQRTTPPETPSAANLHTKADPTRVPVNARLSPEVAAWYKGLGSGSITRGLERAYVLAKAPQTNDSEEGVLAHATALLDHWRIYRGPFHRTSEEAERERTSWIYARLGKRLGRTPTPEQARNVRDVLDRLVRGELPEAR